MCDGGHVLAGMQDNCTNGSFAPKTEMIKAAGARFHDESEHMGCGVPKERRAGRTMIMAASLEEGA